MTAGEEFAPGFVRRTSITYERAASIVAAGLAKAADDGRPSVVAVLDEGGNLLAFGRQDGAPLVGVRYAQLKARTALEVGLGTHALWDLIADEDVVRSALSNDPEMVIVGGGLPIVFGGQVAGAVGVSGGHWSEDLAVAETALAVLG